MPSSNHKAAVPPVLAILVAVAGCDGGCAGAAPEPAAPAAKVTLPAAPSPQAASAKAATSAGDAKDQPVAYRTTAASIHWRNLKSRLGAFRKAARNHPSEAWAKVKLASLLHDRGMQTGDFADFAEATALLDAAVRLDPTGKAPRLARAAVLQTLHRFQAALEDLEVAEGVTPGDRGVRIARAKIHWAIGRYAEAKPALLALARSKPSVREKAALAKVLLDLGQVEAARRQYRAAAEGYSNVKPSIVAWLEVQRGASYLEAGRYEEAKAFFAAAVRRLPGYTLAEEHLAEVTDLLGDQAGAEALYRPVVERSKDPVLAAALAAAVQAQGRSAEARGLVDEAETLLKARLETHPEATWDQAAHFYLEQRDDPARARPFAERNAELRPEASALALLGRVRAAAGDHPGALSAIRRALATPIRKASIHHAAHEVHARAGRAAEAAEQLTLARALNPRLEAVAP